MTTCPICQTEIDDGANACPVCGFHLSGKTLEFKPIDLNEVEVDLNDAGGNALLRMVRGPQVGLTYPLSKGETTIGRNPNCDIFLNDMTVSRMHATIYREGDTAVIEDAESYNGVWVNNQSVERKALTPGDFIQLGKFGFVFDNDEGGR